MVRTTRLGTKLPRVPLPRQTEKIHQKKSKARKVKHKGQETDRTFSDDLGEDYYDYLDD